MNMSEMTYKELKALDPSTLSLQDLRNLKHAFARALRNKEADDKKLEEKKARARQTTVEHTYVLPKPLSVAWLADSEGIRDSGSQFAGMEGTLEGIVSKIHVTKHTYPRELKGVRRDLVIVDFGGVGENVGDIVVYSNYCEPVRKLIEECPNTLFVFRTTWTSMWMNNYLEYELQSDMRVAEYTNTVHKKNDFGDRDKPLHTTDWGKAILEWFDYEHIETRVPAHPGLQHLLEST